MESYCRTNVIDSGLRKLLDEGSLFYVKKMIKNTKRKDYEYFN